MKFRIVQKDNGKYNIQWKCSFPWGLFDRWEDYFQFSGDMDNFEDAKRWYSQLSTKPKIPKITKIFTEEELQ